MDAEIRRILEEQFARAREVIESDLPAMERVVAALIEYERITGEEFEKLYDGEEVQLVSYREKQAVLETADPKCLPKKKPSASARRKKMRAARPRRLPERMTTIPHRFGSVRGMKTAAMTPTKRTNKQTTGNKAAQAAFSKHKTGEPHASI